MKRKWIRIHPSLTAGISFKYYEGTLDSLPDFSKLNVVKNDTVKSINFPMIGQKEYFALLFEGYIRLPSSDIYAFYTASEDGSRLFIDDLSILIMVRDSINKFFVIFSFPTSTIDFQYFKMYIYGS